jgi:hypothetical protein
VAEPAQRERSIAAYAAEIRAFHGFFAAVLIVLAVLHLFVLLPYTHLRRAAPVLRAALEAAEQQRTAAAEAEQAVEAASTALVAFRRDLDAAPRALHGAVADLVARGRLAAGAGGDPYKAAVTESAPATAPAGAETVIVEEAIRRQIGRLVETLGLALDATLAPLRAIREPPPEIRDAIRTAEESLGGTVLALNEVLRAALDADPGFWERLNGPANTFGSASPRAAEWTRDTLNAVRMLDARLAEARATLAGRRRAQAGRAAVLRERHRETEARAAAVARLAWLPLGPDGWVRLYPLIAGSLTLTALFRLRRILALRTALSGIDLDVLAPSWVIGASTAPGRWWALILVSLPVAATAHAALTALGDASLFAGTLGEASLAMTGVYGLAYGALVVVAIWQLVLVGLGTFPR